MRRNVEITEISDGKMYSAKDMAKLQCSGCGNCCRGMGSSIVLDPWDVCQLTWNRKVTFDELLAEAVELQVVDGVILPNLRMTAQGDACPFLSKEGRCEIHGFRPGVCRLFPLGRYYQGEQFQYFLQRGECHHPARVKTKVQKWLEIPDLRQYEQFVRAWHAFLKRAEQIAAEAGDQQLVKNLSLYVLNQFYRTPYDSPEGFYSKFYQRLEQAESLLDLGI